MISWFSGTACSVFGVLVFPCIFSLFNKLRVQGRLDMATTLTSWGEKGKPHKLRAKVSSSGYLEGCQPLRYRLSPFPFLLSSPLSGRSSSIPGWPPNSPQPGVTTKLLSSCFYFWRVLGFQAGPPHLPFPLPAPPPSLPLKNILNTGGKQV